MVECLVLVERASNFVKRSLELGKLVAQQIAALNLNLHHSEYMAEKDWKSEIKNCRLLMEIAIMN